MFVNINCITYVRISIQILFPAYIFLFLTTESHESVSIRIFNPFSSILLFRYLNPPVSKRKKWLARNDSSEELESVINVAFHYFNAFDWYLYITASIVVVVFLEMAENYPCITYVRIFSAQT